MLRNIAVIPGPEKYTTPLFSTNVVNIVQYEIDSVVKALLKLDFIEITSPENSTYWQWRAVLTRQERNIGIDMSCLDQDEVFWGGSNLMGDCRIEDVLEVLQVLATNGIVSVFMHDSECEMHTLGSIEHQICARGSGI